jgi:hypothetical protein
MTPYAHETDPKPRPHSRGSFVHPCQNPVVKLSALLKSLRNVLWRQSPVIYPERLKHSIDADGRHRFELVLEANEVENDLANPVHHSAPAMGLSTGGFGKKGDDE